MVQSITPTPAVCLWLRPMLIMELLTWVRLRMRRYSRFGFLMIRAVVSTVLVLLSGCGTNASSLRDELRKESAVSGLALVEGRGDQIVVISFDGAEKYFRTNFRQPFIFGTAGRMVLWWDRVQFLNATWPIIESVDGETVMEVSPPSPEFSPRALNETAGRLAFWGLIKRQDSSPALRWASIDFSSIGFISQTDDRCDWSPDGNRLVYEKQGTLYIFDVDTGVSKPLIAGHDPTWSTTSKWISYRNLDGHASLVSTDGVIKKWPVGIYEPISPIRWSPEGHFVSFSEAVPVHVPLIGTYYRLVVCRVSDGEAITVRKFGLGTGDTGNFHWIVDYRQFCAACKASQPFN